MKCVSTILLVLFSAITVFGESPVPGDKENFHLFLLAGQSNMAGRGKVTDQDRVENPRVLSLGKDLKWTPAVDPIHFDKPIAGVGLGKTFGLEIVKVNPGITVGLIPCAVGGSPIKSWEPGGYHKQTNSPPYDDAISRTKTALRDGVLKGILWHQGESDSREDRSRQYEKRFRVLIERFRTEFEDPALPIVVGQLAQFHEKPSQF